ncbi:MAG TPA: hypothetical protein VN643_13235 [Pyrinomonadaceae bacterium]|nr:hypothetical protein [Pyrinomonadaceae bacterium]
MLTYSFAGVRLNASVSNQLPLAPLGAGDLIDRAVRMYRRHFFTLIRIAAPPVIIAATGSILMSIGGRQITVTSSTSSFMLFLVLIVVGVLLWAGGNVFSLIVMGGATRNLVTHLLSNERVSARATYAAVKSRFWGLLLAALFISIWLGLIFMVLFPIFYIIVAIVIFGAVLVGQVAPVWFGVMIGIIGGLGVTVFFLWGAFFLIGRIAYVPQAMLVEGKGVFEAIGRSFSLASGNARRLMAMALFAIFGSYSALMILIVPLGWFGYLSGVDLSPFNQENWPAWYTVGYNVILQMSHLLLAPIWMLGLSLLYVDERVRHEGYDIELMAARQLTEMPEIGVVSPLAPALAQGPKKMPPPPMASGSVLGLQR